MKFLKKIFTRNQALKEMLSIKIDKLDIIIDCGANVGDIVKYFCSSQATIYAFEPNPYAFKKLNRRFANYSNVRCIQKGVLDKTKSTKLYFHELSQDNQVKWSVGSSLYSQKGNVAKERYINIKVIDLCKFIKSLRSKIKILKVDIEGAEFKVLNKLISKGVANQIDYIFVERHDNKIPGLKHDAKKLENEIKTRKIKNINFEWA